MRSHGHLLAPLINSYSSTSVAASGVGLLTALPTHAAGGHPFDQTLASAARRSSVANTLGASLTGSASARRAGPFSNATFTATSDTRTSTLTSDSRRESMTNAMHSLRNGSNAGADDGDHDHDMRPVSPRTWGGDDPWNPRKRGSISGAAGGLPGPSQLGTWSPPSPSSLAHQGPIKPRERFPSISLGFGFADDAAGMPPGSAGSGAALPPPPGSSAGYDGLVPPAGPGSRRGSLAPGDAFSLASFGLNIKNPNGMGAADGWGPDSSGGDMLSLTGYRRKSSIIPPKFTAPPPSSSAPGVGRPGSREDERGEDAFRRLPDGDAPIVSARRSSNIGLLLNPVSNGEGSSNDADPSRRSLDKHSPPPAPGVASTSAINGAPSAPTRRGAISAAPEWRGPQTNDPTAPATGLGPGVTDAARGPHAPAGYGAGHEYGQPMYDHNGHPVALGEHARSTPLSIFSTHANVAPTHMSYGAGGMPPSFYSDGVGGMVEFDAMGRKRPIPSLPRQYKCADCPASFVRNHDLRRHARIHLAVKPFSCNDCGKPFSRKDALKRHILVKGCGGRRKRRSNKDDGKKGSSATDKGKGKLKGQDNANEMERSNSATSDSNETATAPLAGEGDDEVPLAERFSSDGGPAHYSSKKMPTYAAMGVGAAAAPGYSASSRSGDSAPGSTTFESAAPYMTTYPSDSGSNVTHTSYMQSNGGAMTMTPPNHAIGLMHDAARSRAATMDSYPRSNPVHYPMWNQQSHDATASSAASHSPSLSTHSSVPFHPGSHIDPTTATLLSPEMARAHLHGVAGSHDAYHHGIHYSSIMPTTNLLTREERRASLTRANSEIPTLPASASLPSSMASAPFHPHAHQHSHPQPHHLSHAHAHSHAHVLGQHY